MYNALAASYPSALTLEDLGLLSLPRQQTKKPASKKLAKSAHPSRVPASTRTLSKPR